MLDFFNLIFLGATLATPDIKLNSLADITQEDNKRVYYAQLREQAPGFNQAAKCRYSGYFVPYARDWEEVDETSGKVVPAEPEKVIGYALIVTKEQCPEKPERDIMHVGSKFLYGGLWGPSKYVTRELHRIDVSDYFGTKPDFRPKWMPQVLKTIKEESSSSEIARDALSQIEKVMQAKQSDPGHD